jgi:hypothetical protein
MTKQNISKVIWGSTFLVYFLPMISWGSELGWKVDEVNLLAIFPLLGLWAFAQMWLHYGIGSIKRRNPDAFDYKGWYKATGNVVLVLILLHPALLVFETAKEGLKPTDYVGSGDLQLLLLAYFALACFLLYEAADRLQSSKFWKKHFGIVKILSILAMLAIFAHSFGLGQNLQGGWLQTIWLIMLAGFVGFIIDSFTFKPKPKSN